MENIVNSLIRDLSKYDNFDVSKVSDGYHTFEELFGKYRIDGISNLKILIEDE